jgi:hypothetical protein
MNKRDEHKMLRKFSDASNKGNDATVGTMLSESGGLSFINYQQRLVVGSAPL